MTLLVSPDMLRRSGDDVRGPLAPLAQSLAADLEPLLRRAPELPAQKALLSRDGGRCPRDGALLDFDPYSAHSHRCPACGERFSGERHDRWWIMSYQLWLAERTVHAALLHALTGDEALGGLAESVLAAVATTYPTYPNVDNVLGPSRPFFSTYLESIWLLQLCVALDFLEFSGRVSSLGQQMRDSVIEPSVALITSYGEGDSNRQVWNNAALLAASRLLGRPEIAERVVHGGYGLVWHLEHALLADGTWYEGENYHLFAHRGLWYGVMLAEQAGHLLPAAVRDRYQEGFAAPMATVMPDLTLPSRRDSHYRISIRQWRFAESFELGLARGDDARLRGALYALYETDAPRCDTGRWRSAAEAERNEPPTALSRSDLGWRSLLAALAELPPLAPVPMKSVLLEGQGIAVLRRDGGRTYVALDYGHSGGGHGHPDRLGVLLARDDARWLDDPGTGSYVDKSLFWYRSTLAHNAPMSGAASQRPSDGELLAWDERDDLGWASAEVPEDGIASGVRVRRHIVVMRDYVVDEVEWEARQPEVFDLPLHAATDVPGVAWRAEPIAGGEDPRDGFAYLRQTETAPLPAGAAHPLALTQGARGWLLAAAHGEWWRATAPGAPGLPDQRFVMARMMGAQARIRCVWSWGAACRVAPYEDGVEISYPNGERHRHRRVDEGWRVDIAGPSSEKSVTLRGIRQPELPLSPPRAARMAQVAVPSLPAGASPRDGVCYELAQTAYRRSELAWADAGSPTATVCLAMVDRELQLLVSVRKDPLFFRSPDAPDPALDNEQPDIHSDGVQLHLWRAGWTAPAAWVIVPEPDGNVRLSVVAGSVPVNPPRATWARTEGGYEVSIALGASMLAGSDVVWADVLVNDMGAGRSRRRGQLVLSGADGEFVYLRGDRQPVSRFLRFALPADG